MQPQWEHWHDDAWQMRRIMQLRGSRWLKREPCWREKRIHTPSHRNTKHKLGRAASIRHVMLAQAHNRRRVELKLDCWPSCFVACVHCCTMQILMLGVLARQRIRAWVGADVEVEIDLLRQRVLRAELCLIGCCRSDLDVLEKYVEDVCRRPRAVSSCALDFISP